MIIAVVQHRLRATPSEDAAALASEAARAASRGAELIVLPQTHSAGHEAISRSELAGVLGESEACYVQPCAPGSEAGGGYRLLVAGSRGVPEGVGRMALLVGDECLDPAHLSAVLAEEPDAIVLAPRSENELQAEAFMELAIALSDSVAGLVVIAECVGAGPGKPGHGGSAIVVLGEVVAEALEDDELLFADVAIPVPQPAPREPLPEIPLLLKQRLAFHEGHKLAVPGYPADLT